MVASGTILNDNFIVTNKHITEDYPYVIVKFYNGEIKKTYPLPNNFKSDLTILSLDKSIKFKDVPFSMPKKNLNFDDHLLAKDMFTPRTVRKYTGHLNGAIYGAPNKIKDGRTHLENLYLAGTDQGFLGIVGAMLSGISMANMHVLQGN